MSLFRFFSIPTDQPEAIQGELNGFLQSHRIVKVERYFEAGAFHFCVEYLAGGSVRGSDVQPAIKERLDYKEILNEKEFAEYLRMRAWRKELAEERDVAVFTILTNAQMAEVIQKHPKSKAELKALSGFGEKRWEQFGEAILGFVEKLKHETGKLSDSSNS